MVHLDAFTVQAVMNQGKLRALVYVHKDEKLSLCYSSRLSGAGPNGLHLVFFCITLCGEPAMAVLMKTGSKHLPAPLPMGVKFWWQMLVQLGIGTAEDEKRLEDLAQSGFKVCFRHVCCVVFAAASLPLIQQHRHYSRPYINLGSLVLFSSLYSLTSMQFLSQPMSKVLHAMITSCLKPHTRHSKRLNRSTFAVIVPVLLFMTPVPAPMHWECMIV